MEQTTARLRKTFQYPTDNGSEDSLPEALDEEGVSLSFKLSLLLPNHPSQLKHHRTGELDTNPREREYNTQ
jgi:hypothetical protein